MPNHYRLKYTLHIDALLEIGPLNNETFIEAAQTSLKLSPIPFTMSLIKDLKHKTNIGISDVEVKKEDAITT